MQENNKTEEKKDEDEDKDKKKNATKTDWLEVLEVLRPKESLVFSYLIGTCKRQRHLNTLAKKLARLNGFHEALEGAVDKGLRELQCTACDGKTFAAFLIDRRNKQKAEHVFRLAELRNFVERLMDVLSETAAQHELLAVLGTLDRDLSIHLFDKRFMKRGTDNLNLLMSSNEAEFEKINGAFEEFTSGRKAYLDFSKFSSQRDDVDEKKGNWEERFV